MQPYISKSDFKVARTCRTKLFYKKRKYPSAYEDDDYMRLLADGGFMVGKLAQLLYPGGYEIVEPSLEEDILTTEELLKSDNIILFEPAILCNHKLVKVDILVKNGLHFDLIEVKSKGFDYEEYLERLEPTNRKIDLFETSSWKEYIEDVAFQKWTLQEKFKDHTITSYLLIPDKKSPNSIEQLINWFTLIRSPTNDSRREKIDVLFSGDISQVRNNHFMKLIDVSEAVSKAMISVQQHAQLFIEDLLGGTKFQTELNCNCNKCEYSVSNLDFPESGFEQCWGVKSQTKPHILQLGHLGNFNRNGVIDSLIKDGKVSLKDIPVDLVQGRYGNRPYYQVAVQDEFLKTGFFEAIRHIEYPLHFIDFETSRMAIPYHEGMRPWGLVFFQWSCHTIEEPGNDPIHREWLNDEDVYPNYKCGQSLMDVLGTKGTFMVWSNYERSVLNEIKRDSDYRYDQDEILNNWIERIAGQNTGHLLDLHDLCKEYYFHPLMGARTSIKVVLPAVLSELTGDEPFCKHLEKESLLKKNSKGQLIDPYELLPRMDIYDKAEKIKDGTGAMRAYQDMLYGEGKGNPNLKIKYSISLKEYCKLDTLAMLMIWEYWNNMTDAKIKTLKC